MAVGLPPWYQLFDSRTQGEHSLNETYPANFNCVWLIHPCDRQTDGQAIAYSTLITLIEYEYRVSSGCWTHGTTAAFSERMMLSPSTSLRWRVFRTQPMVSAWTSVHWTSVRPSWMIVRAIRRWMPWCSRNVPQHGRSSACDTLVDTYLAQQTQQLLEIYEEKLHKTVPLQYSSFQEWLSWVVSDLVCRLTRYSCLRRQFSSQSLDWCKAPTQPSQPIAWLKLHQKQQRNLNSHSRKLQTY